METIYYNIDAKRLTVSVSAEGQRACGGQDTVCYAFVPSRGRRLPERGGNNVVDFTAYRQKRMNPPVEETLPEEEPDEAPESRPVVRRWKLLDLCTSAAVAAAALVILVRFIAL